MVATDNLILLMKGRKGDSDLVMPKVTEFITKLVELGCDLEEWSTSPWLSN